jgi:hypothetical protein
MGMDTVTGSTMTGIIGVMTTMVGATAAAGSIMVDGVAVMKGTVVDLAVGMAVAVSRMAVAAMVVADTVTADSIRRAA